MQSVFLYKYIDMFCVRLFLFLPIFFSSAQPVFAQNSDGKEHFVKAAIVFNFAKFTEWPSSSFMDENAPLVFSVVGDSMRGTFDQFAGQYVKTRKVEVRGQCDAAGNSCHIVYISSVDGVRIDSLLKTFQNRPVLTVSDTPDFIKRGGMIGLVNMEGKIRFEINLDAVHKAGLSISSHVLRLARVVVSQEGAGK